jgi:hypothetical protein
MRTLHVVTTALLAGGFVLLVLGSHWLLDPTPGDFDFGAAGAFFFGQLLGVAGLVLGAIALVGGVARRRRSGRGAR